MKSPSHGIKSIIITAIALVAVAVSCVRDSDAGGQVRHDLPLDKLQDGDLLFRCGAGAHSQVVTKMDKSQGLYSHVGIAIYHNGKWQVVHAVPGESNDGVDRVKVEPLDSFFLTTRAVRGAAMRLQACDKSIARHAALWAMSKDGVRFDDHYNWADSSQLYCTELVHHAYSSVGIDLTAGRSTHVVLPFFKGDVVLPGDIMSNDSLKLIFSF